MEKMDYQDPQCPFCVDSYKDKPTVHPINVANAVNKIDEYLHKNDYEGAERVLNYWIGEAKAGHDDRGLLSLKNEQMGLLRKLGRGEEALSSADEALCLVGKIGFEGTMTAGTTYVNSATVYKAFGKADKAIPIFEKAVAIYEEEYLEDGDLPETCDMRLGSLYNNMALALTDLSRFDEALSYYEKAIAVMERCENGGQEQAITYLNMADLVISRDGISVDADNSHIVSYDKPETELLVLDYIAKAKDLLYDEALPRDGYHAFICEKCAPSFSFYGFEGVARELAARAKSIYGEQD